MRPYECYVGTVETGGTASVQSAIGYNSCWSNQGTRLPCNEGGPCFAGFVMAHVLEERLGSGGAPVEGRSQNCAASYPAGEPRPAASPDAYTQQFAAAE